VLYILVAISSVSILGWEELSRSSAPFSDIAYSALGPNASSIMSLIALCATINTVLLMLLASSRIIYGMAQSGSLPSFLAAVHGSTQAPWTATLISGILAMSFVFLGDIAFVANVNNFTVFVTFIAINAALIVLRINKPQIKRPFKVPLSWGKLALLPIAGIFFNAFMLAQLDGQVYAIGLALICLGGIAALLRRSFAFKAVQDR